MSLRSDPEKMREYKKEWARKNRNSQKKYITKMRLKAIEMLGGKCIYCGCNIIKALEFNHINGGAYEEYKKFGGCQKKLILDIVFKRRTDIELICRPCNSVHYLNKIKNLGNHWKVLYIP